MLIVLCICTHLYIRVYIKVIIYYVKHDVYALLLFDE